MKESPTLSLTVQRRLSSFNKHWQRNATDFIVDLTLQTSLNHHLPILLHRRHLYMVTLEEKPLMSLQIQPQCNWEGFTSGQVQKSTIFNCFWATVLAKHSLQQLVDLEVAQLFGMYLQNNLSIKFNLEVEIESILWLLSQTKETNHQNMEGLADLIIW